MPPRNLPVLEADARLRISPQNVLSLGKLELPLPVHEVIAGEIPELCASPLIDRFAAERVPEPVHRSEESRFARAVADGGARLRDDIGETGLRDEDREPEGRQNLFFAGVERRF